VQPRVVLVNRSAATDEEVFFLHFNLRSQAQSSKSSTDCIGFWTFGEAAVSKIDD
jgi:hypothetical protein